MRERAVRTGARHLARAGVLEPYVEHGKQAQRSPGGRIACFGRHVVRSAGSSGFQRNRFSLTLPAVEPIEGVPHDARSEVVVLALPVVAVAEVLADLVSFFRLSGAGFVERFDVDLDARIADIGIALLSAQPDDIVEAAAESVRGLVHVVRVGDQAGAETFAPENLGEQRMVFRVQHLPGSEGIRELAAEQARAHRDGGQALGIAAREQRRFGGEPVEVRGGRFGVSQGAEMIGAEAVEHDDDDVLGVPVRANGRVPAGRTAVVVAARKIDGRKRVVGEALQPRLGRFFLRAATGQERSGGGGGGGFLDESSPGGLTVIAAFLHDPYMVSAPPREMGLGNLLLFASFTPRFTKHGRYGSPAGRHFFWSVPSPRQWFSRDPRPETRLLCFSRVTWLKRCMLVLKPFSLFSPSRPAWHEDIKAEIIKFDFPPPWCRCGGCRPRTGKTVFKVFHETRVCLARGAGCPRAGANSKVFTKHETRNESRLFFRNTAFSVARMVLDWY